MFRRFASFTMLVLLASTGCGQVSSETEPSRPLAREVAPPAASATVPIAVVAAPSPPAGIAFLTDYDAALASARQEGKPLFLFFGAQWCSHTQRMVGELPADPVVAKLAGDFVCVRLDVDAVPKLCEEYRVRAYPTLILAAPGGVVLQRLTGLQASRDVALEMSAALTAVANRFPPTAGKLQR